MVNIEKIKRELLKGKEIEIQPNTFATEILEDFRRDFQSNARNSRQNFYEACGNLKNDFHNLFATLKKCK